MLKPPILVDVWDHKYVLLSAIPLGATLGYGAYMWGRKERDLWLGIRTAMLFVVLAAAMRLWFASFAKVDVVKKIYDDIGQGKLNWRELFSLDPAHPLWQLLVLIILVTAFIGMSTILVGHVFNRAMHDIPRLATGALLGAMAVPLFLLFVGYNSSYAADTGVLNARLQFAGIILSGMIWEAALGANAGWAYWWHVAAPDKRTQSPVAAPAIETLPESTSATLAPRPTQAVDRFWGPAVPALNEPAPQQTANRGTA